MKNEKSMFLELLGESPMIKVLDFLLVSRDFDYSRMEIAKNSDLSWNTLASIWHSLESEGIVIKTRRVGKRDMFKLNTAAEKVKLLMKFDDMLINYSIENVASAKKEVTEVA